MSGIDFDAWVDLVVPTGVLGGSDVTTGLGVDVEPVALWSLPVDCLGGLTFPTAALDNSAALKNLGVAMLSGIDVGTFIELVFPIGGSDVTTDVGAVVPNLGVDPELIGLTILPGIDVQGTCIELAGGSDVTTDLGVDVELVDI